MLLTIFIIVALGYYLNMHSTLARTLDPNYLYLYYLKKNTTIESIAINEFYLYPKELELNVTTDDVNTFNYFNIIGCHNKGLTAEKAKENIQRKSLIALSKNFHENALVTYMLTSSVPSGVYFFPTIGSEGIAINVKPIYITETDNYTRFAIKKEVSTTVNQADTQSIKNNISWDENRTKDKVFTVFIQRRHFLEGEMYPNRLNPSPK